MRQLLGKGRKDESGDFTKGAEPDPRDQIVTIVGRSCDIRTASALQAAIEQTPSPLIRASDCVEASTCETWPRTVLDELRDAIAELVDAAGYGADRIRIDPSVVRGLEYYTGPVFEAELTFEVKNEDGQTVRFGSVGGGGRYDGLVARFTGQKVPATGFSIGVSRLQAALAALNKDKAAAADGPVVVLVMDKDRARRLPEDGADAAPGRHPRRDVPRHRRHEGADEIRRQARRPVRRHPGRRRARQGRGPDQGPDRGRQGRRHHQGQQGMARGRPAQVIGAGGRPGRRGARRPRAAQGLKRCPLSHLGLEEISIRRPSRRPSLQGRSSIRPAMSWIVRLIARTPHATDRSKRRAAARGSAPRRQ